MRSEKERSRLSSLVEYGVLDTPVEERFDRLTRLAAEIFDAPIALVSLIDSERQWFKSHQGLEAAETPREWAFCDHAIDLDPGSTLIVTDATQDPRFAENPLVTGALNIRFYAGAVLTNAKGHNLGTLCVIDTKVRAAPTQRQIARLQVLAAIVVDELELRRAVGKLDEKGRMLELAERMSGVGHWRVQADNQTVEWSDEVYRIHGVDRATYSPQYDTAVRFYGPADQAKVDALVSRAMTTGEGFEFEMSLRRADGVLRDVMSRADCQRDETGRIIAVVGVFQDVTDHNNTVSAVRKSQQQYKLLADHVGDAIARVGLDGSGIYVSPAMERLLGYTPAEMARKKPHEYLLDEDQHLVLAAFAEMGAGVEERTLQYRVVHKLGHAIWVENRLRLVRDETGKPIELVAAIRDISERKRLEDELRVSQIEAQAAAAAKSDFLANMSHELRTPLTSILGFSDLAAAQADISSSTRRFLDRVRDGSRALLCTVNDILDFSKLEAGQVKISPVPACPAALCRATLDLMAPQAAAKDLELKFVCDTPTDLWVVIDPDRVRQVLLNLIGNAVKFTQAGTVSVRLGYNEAGGQLQIEVIDTGPGIAAENQARLFQRFSQIDGTLARQAGGTGLGLAICKGLIEAMGGSVGVTSQLGLGSCFRLQIPAPMAASPATSVGPDDRPEKITVPGVRVLIADDHHANRDLASLFLTGVGAEVTVAIDGREAVELAALWPYDVILLDLRMPVLDGSGACAEIRSPGGLNEHTPILAFTADSTTGRADLDPAAQFDGVVFKPIESIALISAVAGVTDFAGDLRRREQRNAE